jgi:hypothetical protein
MYTCDRCGKEFKTELHLQRNACKKNIKKRQEKNESMENGNDKRIASCKLIGGRHKKEGHRKEKTFNQKYHPECTTLTMKAESDCQIDINHQILLTLRDKEIISSNEERNTSNKSGNTIQFVLGVPEINSLSHNERLNYVIENIEELSNKYLKKNKSDRPADLLVYDTGESRLFFNMDEVINFIVVNCKFRNTKIRSQQGIEYLNNKSKCIYGDFEDDSKKGIRKYLTIENRGKNHNHSIFFGINGECGIKFINLIKNNVKYYDDPY